MPLYNTREPTLLESPAARVGPSPELFKAYLPLASSLRQTAIARSFPSPLSLSLSSLGFVIRLAIYPLFLSPPPRRSYRSTDDTSIHVREREEKGYFDVKEKRYSFSNRIEKEKETERNGTSLGVERRPRRKRERGNRSHGETWPRCGLYLKDGRGGSRSYVRTYVRTYVARRAVRSRIVK